MLCHPSARPRPEPAPAPTSVFFSSHHFRFPLPPPSPTSSRPAVPVSPPPRAGRAMPSSYPSPSCPASPSFFIKLLKQQSVAVVTWRSAQLAGPAVLPNDNTAGAQLAAGPCPPGGPLVLHLLLFLRSQWRLLHIERSHRKTKT